MWAIVLSLVFYPVYAFILKYVKYKFVSSILTLLIIILILIGPFSYFAYVLSQELISLVSHFQAQNGNASVVQTLLSHPLVNSTVQKISECLPYDGTGIVQHHFCEPYEFRKAIDRIDQVGFWQRTYRRNAFRAHAALDLFLPRRWTGVH